MSGRPAFLGRSPRPTLCSRRSTNASSPKGQPVQPWARKSPSSSSGNALLSKARQSATIASNGPTFTKPSSRRERCDLALLQRHAGVGDQAGSHRIEFDVACRRQQVRLVHDEGCKPSLPQVSPPFLAEVDAPRIAPMSLANGTRQSIFRPRHRNQMNVIGHQAVRPNVDAALAAPLGHQIQVGRIIVVAKERLLPAVAPLRYVMRQAGHDQSRKPRHARILANLTQSVNIGSYPRTQLRPSFDPPGP